MKYLVLITINLLMLSTLLAVTWEIKQDGTGDFTTIGAGITVAQDGDILLVYPGIYYERINYQGKNITITSLYDGDEYDESYIANTIIDGNHEGTVVIFNSGETRDAVLNGFTIRHGKGEFHIANTHATRGGGIYIYYSSPTISNCRIKYNRASVGGGISLVMSGSPFFKGNVISHNHSVEMGGLTAGMGTNIEFCNESLNSIYLNYGGIAADLFLGNTNQSSVIIDTMTVLNPDRYFVVFRDDVPQDFELIVNHGKIEPLAADLYVNPDGSDTNSGLSPDEPLQTIMMAMIKILPDSENQRTVHLAEGIYSRSANDQLFPIQPRNYINITGENKETTILDLEEETLAFYNFTTPNHHFPGVDQAPYTRNYTLKNLTIINGSNPMGDTGFGAMYLYFNSSFTLENIDIYNCHTGIGPVVQCGQETVMFYHSSNITLKNLHLHDNSGRNAFHISSDYGMEPNLYAENIRIRNHRPGPFNPDYTGGEGRAFSLGTRDMDTHTPLYADIVNMEITDCSLYNSFPPWANLPSRSNFVMSGSSGHVRIINSTIGNNYSASINGGGLYIGSSINLELINSILYGNTTHQISLENDSHQPGNVYISHSLIQGGEDNIHYYSNPNTTVHWGEGNIDADPLWLGVVDPDYTGDYPYMLSEYSPARNAGTLDIPNFEFPQYDLAGNPRIYGDSIDIGAYEWNPEASIDDNDTYHATSLHTYNLHNYPNPVVSLKGIGRGKGVGTNISFIMPKEGNVVIDIYNVKGQFIRRLINAFMVAGEYNFLWNGKDEQERIAATGFYMYRLEIDGETVATGRCTFIK